MNSLDELLKAATWGDPAAQRRLGELYLYGLDTVTINYAETAKLLKLASDQGFAHAKGKLGIMHEFGQDMPIDEERASERNLQVAERNGGAALLSPGYFYEHGKGGLPKDDRLTAELYEKARVKLSGVAKKRRRPDRAKPFGLGVTAGMGEGTGSDADASGFTQQRGIHDPEALLRHQKGLISAQPCNVPLPLPAKTSAGFAGFLFIRD